MNTNNKNSKNEFFLSQWIEGKLTDIKLKSLVTEEEFLAFCELRKGIDLYSNLEQPFVNSFEKVQNKIKNSTKSNVRSLNYKWIASAAAILLLFIGYYSVLNTEISLNESNFGEQKVVALLDGSEVVLNAKSVLTYNKKDWENKRELFLEGEAYFKVKKGSLFTVKTKKGDVTVLGTTFSVNSTDDYLEVICFSGKVSVLNNNKRYVLNPTEAFRKINGNSVEKLNYTETSSRWINGESSYKSVPLKYVLIDLEKQFHIKIKQKNIDSLVLFTGSFSHKDKELAYKTVFEAMNLQYKITNKNTIVLSK